MGILGLVIYPALTPDRVANPLQAAITRTLLMTIGLVWVFVLAMLMVYREEGDLRWATLHRGLWLNVPRDPKSGEPRRRLWLWLIPIVVLSFASQQSYGLILKNLWVRILPFLAPPPGYDPGELFASPEMRAQLVGAWGFYGLFLVMLVFNILGEEFLFRGVLLPKMEGVFGKWDWIANGVLFGLFRLHEPLDHPSGGPRRGDLVRSPGQAVSQYLVGDHCSLCGKRGLAPHDTHGRAGLGQLNTMRTKYVRPN